MSQEKKTRLKGTKTEKTCAGPCGKTKDRFKDFKPRWSRCAKHRIKGAKSDPNCADCVTLVNSVIRQPKCIECDAKRSTKKGKKTTAAPTPVTVAPVAPAAPTAPEATPVQAPAPVEPTPVQAATPEPVAQAPAKAKKGFTKLADIAKLIEEPASGATESPL